MSSKALNVLVVLILSVISVSVEEDIRTVGVSLGKLHWCNTLCLCHDDTHEKLQCFSDPEIYSLLDVDPRKVQRLSKADFKLEEKLTWCNETCLCHKSGRKEFKCTGTERLGEFIKLNAPSLSHYLESEVEIFDVRDIVDHEDEMMIPMEGEGEEEHEKKHDKKKNRKHRKNKKKNHHEWKETTEEHVQEEPSSPQPPVAPPVEVVTEPDNRRVLSANIFPQASTGREMPSRSPEAETGEGESPVLEVPRERKTVAGEVSDDITELRDTVDQIKGDISLNQHILLVTVAVAAIAMIGVMLLAIYSCCAKRSSKSVTKGQKNGPSHQAETKSTKVNLDETW